MSILAYFFLGFITAFLGLLFPSMLSLTTIKISIKENQKKVISFALGVSVVAFGQAYLAIAFSKLLLSNPTHLNTLQKAGTIVFIGLSFYFFYQAIKSKRKKHSQPKRKLKRFYLGMLFSFLNMFAIPFYVGMTSSFVVMDWYRFGPENNFCFVLGASIGTFTLLFLYAQLAKRIEKRSEALANQMDFILGVVTALVAIFSTVDLLL